jgi:hypothetical protein
VKLKYFILISIPIILFSAVIFDKYYDPKAIWLNFATEAIFLLLVIFFVDKIVKMSKEENWKETDRLIKLKLGRLADSYIGSLANNLGYGPGIYNQEETSTGNPYKINAEGIRVLKEVIEPELCGKFKNLEKEKQINILNDLNGINGGIDQLISLYSKRIKHNVMQDLLELQEIIVPTLYMGFDHPAILHPLMKDLIHDKDEAICINLLHISHIFKKLDKKLEVKLDRYTKSFNYQDEIKK